MPEYGYAATSVSSSARHLEEKVRQAKEKASNLLSKYMKAKKMNSMGQWLALEWFPLLVIVTNHYIEFKPYELPFRKCFQRCFTRETGARSLSQEPTQIVVAYYGSLLFKAFAVHQAGDKLFSLPRKRFSFSGLWSAGLNKSKQYFHWASFWISEQKRDRFVGPGQHKEKKVLKHYPWVCFDSHRYEKKEQEEKKIEMLEKLKQ